MPAGDWAERPPDAQINQEEWDRVWGSWGRAHNRWFVRLFRALPSSPRCEACGSPFAGTGGRVMRMLGKGPSRKNPRWCGLCFEQMPEGGARMTIGVMFVDVRGSTQLGEELDVLELTSRMNQFYDRVTKIVVRHGIVDKLIGDEVMGIYLPPLSPDGRFVESLVSDARGVLRSLGYATAQGPMLDVGIGLDVGEAFVGHVGGDGVGDFTALGDVVNTAARLQAVANPGEVVMSERVAHLAGVGDDDGRRVELDLKGKTAALDARVVTVA